MIQPTYVTFEQAKALKEKGLNNHFYHRKGEDSSRWIECKYCYDPGDETKTLQLWSDNIFNSTDERLERLISAPEQWQVLEWLRVNHGIWIYIKKLDASWLDLRSWIWVIRKQNNSYPFSTIVNSEKPNDSPQEAYYAAFDYVLKNLI